MLRSTCFTLSCARRSVNRSVPRMVFGGIESSTNTPTTREFSSSLTNVDEKQDVTFSRVYTHPLSQVVLKHLQNVHGDWLVRKGLHRGLTIDRGKELLQGLRPSFLDYLYYLLIKLANACISSLDIQTKSTGQATTQPRSSTGYRLTSMSSLDAILCIKERASGLVRWKNT